MNFANGNVCQNPVDLRQGSVANNSCFVGTQSFASLNKSVLLGYSGSVDSSNHAYSGYMQP